MNPQNIAPRANSNRSGHQEDNHLKSTSTKNQTAGIPKSALPNTPQNHSSDHQTGPQKSEASAKSNSVATASETHPAATPHEPVNDTVFRLDAPAAHTVLLAGDFSEWEKSPIKMLKGGGGVWHAKVLLARGRHQYRFLVDGEWQNDLAQHDRVRNSFGTFNNVLEIH